MLFAALVDVKQTSKIMQGEVRPKKGERFDAFEFHPGFRLMEDTANVKTTVEDVDVVSTSWTETHDFETMDFAGQLN